MSHSKKAARSKRKPLMKASNSQSKESTPVLSFKTASDWRDWLESNETISTGIWIKFTRAHVSSEALSYADARDEAICFGWIDGQIKPIDDRFYLRRFTPRKPNSVWSKFNRELVERLIKENRMTPSGLKQVEAAKLDGRWAKAYDSASTAEPPEDFLERIAKSKKAQKYWDELSRSKRYPMLWKLQSLKTEKKRVEWMERFVLLLSKGEVFEIFPTKKKVRPKKGR